MFIYPPPPNRNLPTAQKYPITFLDVKPSNILMCKSGFVKLCDFGISGYLVDSIAKTQDVGCQVYMAVRLLFYFQKSIIKHIFSLKGYLNENMTSDPTFGL
jgi:serine/threonine protein kinase